MIELTGSSLTLKQMEGILYKGKKIVLNADALERVQKSREAVDQNCPE